MRTSTVVVTFSSRPSLATVDAEILAFSRRSCLRIPLSSSVFHRGFVADLEFGGLATHVGVLPAHRPRQGSCNAPGVGLC